jgi:hypothetical protein
MKKLILASCAAAALSLGAFGCAHEYHQARADAAHDQAKRDARHLHLGDAAHEQHEANVEQRKADESRF